MYMTDMRHISDITYSNFREPGIALLRKNVKNGGKGGNPGIKVFFELMENPGTGNLHFCEKPGREFWTFKIFKKPGSGNG